MNFWIGELSLTSNFGPLQNLFGGQSKHEFQLKHCSYYKNYLRIALMQLEFKHGSFR